jgi:hypothetical protein
MIFPIYNVVDSENIKRRQTFYRNKTKTHHATTKTVQTQADRQLGKPSSARANTPARTGPVPPTPPRRARQNTREPSVPEYSQIRRPAANRTPVWTLLVSRSDICTGIGRPETDRRYPRAAISTGRPPPPPDPLAACRYSPQTPELARVSSQILCSGEKSQAAPPCFSTPTRFPVRRLRPPS